MKKIMFSILLLGSVASVSAQHENHGAPTETNKSQAPKSPRKSAMAMVSTNHVHIDYGSPSVRGRTIWNGLVAYGQVWATGAHKATWIEFAENVKIDGKKVKKGKYGLFTIPGEKEWILILSKDYDMHLADNYTPKNDILRLTLAPIKNDVLTEALTFNVKSIAENKGEVSLTWEYLTVKFEFENLE